MQNIIASGNLPEAITCVNGMTALGAMHALKKNGLKIPGDVVITGFTETPMAELVGPPLTNVVQPTYEMEVIAARH